MLKRDRIFYSACGFSVIGLILALMGFDISLLFFVAAYLLRPAIHELGFGRQYADERQLEIHSKSGNLAFVILIIAMVGMVFWRFADGKSAGELYTLIAIGLAARALSGLIMNGEYRRAGAIIVTAFGLFLALFIILDSGFSIVSVFGLAVGAIIFGLAMFGMKFPKTLAIVLAFITIAIVASSNALQFRRVDLSTWLFFIFPFAIASICFWLGRNKEEQVSGRTARIIFGSLGTIMVVVFALFLVRGESTEQSRSYSASNPKGEITEMSGVTFTGGAEYYDNGALQFCWLARADTLSGQPLPAGTGVHFTKEGVFSWCFLQQNTNIQGYFSRGESHGFMTEFYPNGQVKTVYLAKDQVIQGIPCRRFEFLSAVFNPIHHKNGNTSFYSDGRLMYCELSKDFTIDGKNLRRGDAVWLDENGHLTGPMRPH